MRGRDVDLGDRSGRVRHRIERCKYLLRKRTKLAQDHLADRLVRNGRGLVEKLQQFGAIFIRQQIEPQRECLSDLHPSAAQVLQKKAQAYFGWNRYFSWPKFG